MTWGIGAFIVAITCMIFAALVSLSKHLWVKIAGLLFLPYLSSYTLYWGVAYTESTGIPGSEYSSWEDMLVDTWAIAGYVTCATVLIAVYLRDRKHNTSSNIR